MTLLAGRTVVIADDHRLFAEGVASILRDQQCNTIIVTELEQIRPTIATSRPALLVLDLAFGEVSALPLLRELRATRKRLPILVISASEESVIVERVQETGAAYLPKSRAGADVAEVAEKLISGEYLSPQLKHIRSTAKASAVIGGVKLTRRQIRVLRFVQRGRTNVEISEVLARSVKTIEASMAELYARTGLSSRGALIRWANTQGNKLKQVDEEDG